MGPVQRVIPESKWAWMAMAWISFGVMLAGVLFASWPWWLTLAQGITAAGCFIIGLDADPAMSEEIQV